MNISDWANDFVTLLVITDPPGLIPLFLGLAVGMNGAERQQTARIAAFIAFGIIAVFILCGTALLSFMGISLNAFRVAGGILLFYIAFEMIFDRRAKRKAATAQVAITQDNISNIAAFPLAIPLIAGPGTLSAAILMASKHGGVSGAAGSLIVAAAAIAVCYVFMLLSAPIDRLIGGTGRAILAKLFGILLAAMAVQFVADGLRALLFH